MNLHLALGGAVKIARVAGFDPRHGAYHLPLAREAFWLCFKCRRKNKDTRNACRFWIDVIYNDRRR